MISLVYPDRCYYCGEYMYGNKILICKNCLRTLPLIKGNKCNVCGREEFCCYCKAGDFAFERNISFMRYDGPCKDIISRYKFGKIPQLSEFMGDELSKLIKTEYDGIHFDYVTYVPMHPINKLRRQFNQSELLAGVVAKYLGVPLVNSLKKRFSFKQQKQLGKDERIKQIRDKFKSRLKFNNSTILLIDDVFTTGATLNECSRVLINSGVDKVYTASFAISYKK